MLYCELVKALIALAEPSARDYSVGKAKESLDILKHFLFSNLRHFLDKSIICFKMWVDPVERLGF